ncbi:MAG: ChbG/HpnK family deacetylase [Actinobacteria bacterium]|nr:ChbG/HpnK family deacetylase [Actinomycetota bacterium]
MIRLVVNADDFGRSSGVNRGLFEAHDRGIVTSASLMVRYPAAAEAAALARHRPRLGVGLHVDLGEWVYERDAWAAVYEVDAPVEDALAQQLDEFHRLLDRDPTHLDSHQHVHRRAPAHEHVVKLGHALVCPSATAIRASATWATSMVSWRRASRWQS